MVTRIQRSDEWIYAHPVSGGCGAPKGQSDLAAAQSNLFNIEAADMSQLFGQDQALMREIQSVYGPIFAKGPNQFGFNKAETNVLNSGAAEQVGQAFGAANRTLKENLAAQGGGLTALPSGVLTKAEQGITTAGAAQLSGEQQQIQEAGYQQGYNQFMAATNALMGLPSLTSNAAQFGGVANTGGEAANQTYNSITAENESPFNAVVGALGGAAGGLLGNRGLFSHS